MDNQELIRSLNSIGKGCFVTHYELFRDKVLSDNLFVIEGLVKIESYTESGARIRVGFARGIFKARREHDALKIISESKRLPRQLTAKAKMLLGGNRVPASPRSITPIDTPIRPDAQIILPSRISNPANARPAEPQFDGSHDGPDNSSGHLSAPPNEGCLADAILRQGVWFPPPLLNLLPLLRPYAVRDNACRPRGNANEGERWGLPDDDGFFRDDNSLIKSMPFSFPVSGTENPYNGRKIRNGFVASHGWRKIHDGISHGNPLTYSFIGNVVWLPKEIAPFTDQEGGFGQNFIKAVSWAIFRDFAAHSNMGPFLEKIWSQLPVPDVSVLPANCASRVSYFSLDAKRFSDTNFGLIQALSRAIHQIEREGGSALIGRIEYRPMSLCSRYCDNLPTRLVSSGGFRKLKTVLRLATTAYQN